MYRRGAASKQRAESTNSILELELKTPTYFLFADCTRLLKCCTFRVAALVRRFRVPEGDFVSEASDETR